MNESNQNLLAIVIPAYKKAFFREALQSIARQTNKGFTVYIGDDNSPEDLYPVVQEFTDQLNIVYHRFQQNMGGSDLVAQWHRCIDLTRGEPWIWLFSDDDLMDENCVALFYKTIQNGNNGELFHFNVKIINEHNAMTGKFQPFPPQLSSSDFFYDRVTYALSTYVMEYIFSREVYEREGRFEKFDLAWCSDDATWLKFAKRKGIFTIEGAFVNWRFSQINISAKIEDRKTILRKLAASEAYLKWTKQFFKINHLPDKTSSFQKLKWMLHQFLETSVLSYAEKAKIVSQAVGRLGYWPILLKANIYVAYMERKRKSLLRQRIA